MKPIYKILVPILSVFSTLTTRAQQDPMISQYMTNQIFFNPAYAGTHDYSSVSGLYRKQWVDMPGAPVTGFISYDKNFVDRNVGLGLTFVNDRIGVSNQTEIAAQYAYHIPLQKGHLSFGIKGQLSYYSAAVTDLTVWDKDDQLFMSNVMDKWIPNFGIGSYYYTDNFYAGISIPHLMNYNRPSNFTAAEIPAIPNYERHYYITSGYVITCPNDVFVKPSTLIKYIPHAPVEADLNVNVFFMNRFSVGTSYRTNDGMVAMVEIKATPNIRIGYAYDHPFNQLHAYTSGTHEIMLSYDFIRNIIKMKTPRFF
jgi:type IX secretion system PorP/SprF family membrane protein